MSCDIEMKIQRMTTLIQYCCACWDGPISVKEILLYVIHKSQIISKMNFYQTNPPVTWRWINVVSTLVALSQHWNNVDPTACACWEYIRDDLLHNGQFWQITLSVPNFSIKLIQHWNNIGLHQLRGYARNHFISNHIQCCFKIRTWKSFHTDLLVNICFDYSYILIKPSHGKKFCYMNIPSLLIYGSFSM